MTRGGNEAFSLHTVARSRQHRRSDDGAGDFPALIERERKRLPAHGRDASAPLMSGENPCL
jgi:hypothetical protein